MDTTPRVTTTLLLLLLLVVADRVQGGPYVSKARPVAGPLVDEAQSRLHQRFLQVEAQVLRESLDITRLAARTTELVYRHTREATAALNAMGTALEAEVGRLKESPARACVDPAYRQITRYINNLSEKLYNCSHGVSNSGAWHEVKLTYRLIAARDQVWYIKQAMTFCQKFQQNADTDCLKRLSSEGELMLRELPESGRAVLSQAQAAEGEVMDRLGRCLTRHKTAAEAKHLAEMERMRACEQRLDN